MKLTFKPTTKYKGERTGLVVMGMDYAGLILENTDKGLVLSQLNCKKADKLNGADGQLSSIDNLSRCINAGMRYSIPTLGVVAVGKDMERTDRFFKLATRIVAEMGVQLVKTYYCDNFEEVVAACPVPIVVAGGKKLPEDEALTLAYRSIQGGARGLDMGRNIFQSNHPVEMAKAIRMIVHQKATDKEAFEFYTDAIHTK